MFSKLVRAKGFCHRCLKTEGLQCAHVFSRRYLTVRWDFRNAFCLCQGCHVFFTHRPIEWEDWCRKQMGDQAYDTLRLDAIAIGQKPDYDVIIGRLREKAKEMAA